MFTCRFLFYWYLCYTNTLLFSFMTNCLTHLIKKIKRIFSDHYLLICSFNFCFLRNKIFWKRMCFCSFRLYNKFILFTDPVRISLFQVVDKSSQILDISWFKSYCLFLINFFFKISDYLPFRFTVPVPEQVMDISR